MATITNIIKDEKKGGIKQLDLKDVHFFWTRFKTPQAIKEQKDWANPTRFEYSVTCLIDEDTFDELEAIAPKQKYDKYLKDKFVERFFKDNPEDVPFDAKKYYTVTLKQKTHMNNGELFKKRPRVFAKNDEGKTEDVTMKQLVGNGSKGNIRITGFLHKEHGQFLFPSMMMVTDLISYGDSEGGSINEADSASDFLGCEVELEDLPTEINVEEAKSKSPDNDFEESSEDFSDDDLPFDDDDFE